MKMPMNCYNRTFLLGFLTSGLMSLGLGLGCKQLSKEEQDELHRPRKDQPFLQQKAVDPAPLIGFFVDVNSTASSPDGKSWATAFPTIQQAIDASSGHDIIVAAGVYKNPNLRIHNKLNVYLKGGYKAGDKFEKARSSLKSDELVILDGENNPSPLVRIDGQSQRIHVQGGFVFKNVRDTPAVIIQGTDAAHPIKEVSITNSSFETNINNVAGSNGGGIRAQYVEGLGLVDVEADDNRTTAAGGFLYAADVKGLDLVGGSFKNNRAQEGGAIYLARVERLNFAQALIEGNLAERGGGVYARELNNQVIKDVQLVKNQGPLVDNTFGGGMMIKDCRAVRLLGTSFVENRLNENFGFNSWGGSLYIEDSIGITMDFGNARIVGNKAVTGGAIAIRKSSAITQSKDIAIQGGLFEANEASVDAGAVFAFNTENMTLRGSKFLANRAAKGGAIQIKKPAGTIRLDDLTLDGNHARLGGGLALNQIRAGAIYLEGSSAGPAPAPHVVIENSTIANSHAPGNGGAVVAQDVDYTVEFKRTLFKNNRSDNFGGALALDANTKPAARFIVGQGTQFFNNSSARGAGGGAIYLTVRTGLGAPVPATAEDRNLVFYIKHADQRDNATGTVMVAGVAQPNSTNRFGKFLRVGNQNIADIAPADFNPNLGTAASPRELAAPFWLLRRYVPYSLNPAHVAAPWNQLKLNWQNVSEAEVYAW